MRLNCTRYFSLIGLTSIILPWSSSAEGTLPRPPPPAHAMSDPRRDAEQALKNGDFSLYCTNGVVSCIHIPGVSPEKQAEARTRFKIKIKEGTSDYITPEVIAEVTYAEAYNRYVLERSPQNSLTE